MTLPIFSLIIVLLLSLELLAETAVNTSPITIAKFSVFLSKSSAEDDSAYNYKHLWFSTEIKPGILLEILTM